MMAWTSNLVWSIGHPLLGENPNEDSKNLNYHSLNTPMIRKSILEHGHTLLCSIIHGGSLWLLLCGCQGEILLGKTYNYRSLNGPDPLPHWSI